jgi:hypothetical protein
VRMALLATLSGLGLLVLALANALIHPTSERGCMKSGPGVVIRYSSRYEKALPNRSF